MPLEKNWGNNRIFWARRMYQKMRNFNSFFPIWTHVTEPWYWDIKRWWTLPLRISCRNRFVKISIILSSIPSECLKKVVFFIYRFKKQAFCYVFAFKIIKKMRFRASFILKKCKTRILTRFRFYKIQKTSVLLLFCF